MVSDARRRMGKPLENAEQDLRQASTIEEYRSVQENLAQLTANRPRAATFYGRTPERVLSLVDEAIETAADAGDVADISAEAVEATYDDTIEYAEVTPTNPVESLLAEATDKLWRDVRATESP